MNTQVAGCPDWTKLELNTLGEDVVSPLANFAPTGNIFSPGWRLQGPLGGTQALQVRLAAWNVTTSTRTVSGTLQVTVSGCLNNNDVYYQPQLTTNAVAAAPPGELVGELTIRLDSNSNPTGFTIDTSGTALGGNSEAPFCRQ